MFWIHSALSEEASDKLILVDSKTLQYTIRTYNEIYEFMKAGNKIINFLAFNSSNLQTYYEPDFRIMKKFLPLKREDEYGTFIRGNNSGEFYLSCTVPDVSYDLSATTEDFIIHRDSNDFYYCWYKGFTFEMHNSQLSGVFMDNEYAYLFIPIGILKISPDDVGMKKLRRHVLETSKASRSEFLRSIIFK